MLAVSTWHKKHKESVNKQLRKVGELLEEMMVCICWVMMKQLKDKIIVV